MKDIDGNQLLIGDKVQRIYLSYYQAIIGRFYTICSFEENQLQFKEISGNYNEEHFRKMFPVNQTDQFYLPLL